MRSFRSRGLAIGLGLLLSLTPLAVSDASASPTASTSWTTVVYDTFDTGTTYPAHWKAYSGHYRRNCALPAHNTVSNGSLQLELKYEPNTALSCGAGWYSGGLKLDTALSAPNQRVTIRFRIVSTGGAVGHRIIPMLNPDDGTHVGEQDLCESTPTTFCSTFLHYGAPGTYQTRKKYFFDLTQWHTMVFTLNGYHVTSSIDGVPKMDYTGNETTLPSKLRHVVLQQECDKYGCPSNLAGVEDIQIDYIQVENGN